MVDYSKTKIYRISVGNDNYYGHTAQTLSQRARVQRDKFHTHPERKVYKTLRENNLTEKDIQLVWVEDYPCKSKAEAHARERYWIEIDGTLNMRLPYKEGQTRQEYLNEKKIEYYYVNHEKNKEKNRAKYDKNKETIKAKQDKEKNKEKWQRYYDANKEKLQERWKEITKKKQRRNQS